MAKKKATKATFDLDDAIEDCEADAESHPHAQALAAPQTATKGGAVSETFRSKVAAMSTGGIWLLLLNFGKKILETEGPAALAWLIDFLNKKISGGTGTTTPAPTQ
jgi:hypothetical protein